jgi:penicillin amidase
MTKRKLLVIVGMALTGLVMVAAIIAFGTYWYYFHRPLPQIKGEIQVQELKDTVRVYRGPNGMAHILAENTHDLFFAQGFVQAQDRLWQIELNRRVAAGRLSEIAGKDMLPADRIMRTFGLYRAAQNEWDSYDDQSRAILTAFCQGVNALAQKQRHRLPIEFQLLDIPFEPYTELDALAWAKTMALGGAVNWQEEIVRAMLVAQLGVDKTVDLLSNYQPFTTPMPLDTSAVPKGWNITPALLPLQWNISLASNAWVVSENRTRTGSPMLANDTHLPLQIPSFWYETHLSGGGYNVLGLSVAGLPLVMAGHNNHVAWGITYACVDNQDLYYEQLNPNKRGQYRFQENWYDSELVTESIKVKGQSKPARHETFITSHGPIISRVIPETQRLRRALAFKWSAYETGQMLPVLNQMNLARDADEFKAAALKWCEPALNVIYADTNGKIGYLLAARIPVRKGGHGQGPFAGWTGSREWIGYLSPDQKPNIQAPPNGFAVSANNLVTPPEYPHFISWDCVPAFRAARIEQFLNRHETVDAKDIRDLQGDLLSMAAGPFVEAVSRVDVQSPQALALIKILMDWDQHMTPDSQGGAVYTTLMHRLLENTLRDELESIADNFFGQGLAFPFSGNLFGIHSQVIMTELLNDPASPWFNDVTTTAVETMPQIMEKSLLETRAFLIDRLGKNPKNWQWGRLHISRFEHPLAQHRLLKRLLNLGPYPGAGHFSTVKQSGSQPGGNFHRQVLGVSSRFIYDLSDWDQCKGMIVPGQSGQPGSPYYDDQVDFWQNLEYHTLPFTRAAIENKAESVLTLKPDQ